MPPSMEIKYKHTNIIAENWENLARFYENVFDCRRVPPERDQSGDWLAKGTGVENAHLRGVHLRLPGYGPDGPTLEIYQYSSMEEKSEPRANRKGFGHIAFEVVDVGQVLENILQHGGRKIGEITSRAIEGVGNLTFVYAADVEGNIVELQKWERK